MDTRINLRTARKAAKRRLAAERAVENRVIHGRTKWERQLQAAKATQAERRLEAHRLETGDER